GPGCDVYSLGVILFELLTGRVPFDGPTLDVLAKHVRDRPPPPTALRPDVDPAIEAVCLKALAKEPSQRFLSLAEFARALEDYLSGSCPLGGAAEAEADPVGQAVAEALVLLRTWGWEAGIGKVRARLDGPWRQASGLPGEERQVPNLPQAGGEPDPRHALLLRWLEGDAAAREEVKEQCGVARQLPGLAGWALLGQAFAHNRDHNFAPVEG